MCENPHQPFRAGRPPLPWEALYSTVTVRSFPILQVGAPGLEEARAWRGVITRLYFPAAFAYAGGTRSVRGRRRLAPSHRAAGSWPVHMNGEARTARLSRVGGTATPPLTTVLARAARKPEDPLLASISTSRPKRQWGPKRRAGPAGRWGGGWRGAGPEERGAGRAGQGGPGASLREEVPAPRFGEVRPRRLRTAPCAPSPTIGPDLAARGPCGGGAGGSRARPVSVRARGDEDGGPAPAGPGPRAVRGGSLGSWLRDPHPRTPAAGSTWTLGRGGTERAPRPHVGEGALQPVPLFCSSAWGSDCSKGGRKNPGFRVSRPPQPGGEGPRRDTPSAPAPLDLAASEPWSRRGGAAPRPQPIGPGAGRPPERRRRTSCRLTRVPAAAAHAPSTGRVGPRASVAPPPPLAIGSLVSGAPRRVPGGRTGDVRDWGKVPLLQETGSSGPNPARREQ